MDRHGQQVIPRGRPVSSIDAARASDCFEYFINANSLKSILGYYRSICEYLHLRPNLFPIFYPKLKANLTHWKAKAIWKKIDARASHKCYGKGKICSNTRVLIIGAGPCGLRTAIEAQLLGAKVVVVEKRDRLSRNNVLHLWPFVIEDLRILGAKKFFGKFCAGAIDHISIRQLQCILFKVALLLGVEIHTEVSFERLIEPNAAEKTGWRAEFKPSDHPVSQYEFDVIIGADGKRNTLQGFKRKEFRGKLAIAITANFINKKTEAEAVVEEISGVAFIFNQKFFKDLYEKTGIDLENIVYYKDDTHYFVMTAKKPSLIEKGVILQDLADTERLLAPDNVNREALMNYAKEAADFSTKYQMPDLEFAVNHYGLADVAMFDFTSMYAAENASKVLERNGYRLLMILVGDSLLEPFWPTGSGCARGFLSSMDAAWAIRSWGSGTATPLEVLAERESIYRLLAQTTPDNLNKDCKAYTLDPTTRYPNLNRNVLLPHQVIALYDTDNPMSIERMRRNSQDTAVPEIPKKRRRGNVDSEVLLNWISEQVKEHEDIQLTDLPSVFRNGKSLCAVLNHYRPDLVDYNSIKDDDPIKNNQLAIDILEKELGVTPIMTGEEITNTEDYLTMATYLTQVYDTFRCEIPHIKHPKLDGIIYSSNNIQSFTPEIPQKNSNSLITLYHHKTSKGAPLKELDSSTIIKMISKRIKKKLEKKLLSNEYSSKTSLNKKTVIRVKKSKTSIKKYVSQIIKKVSNDFANSLRNKNRPLPSRQIKYYDENFQEINPDKLSNVSSLHSLTSKSLSLCKTSLDSDKKSSACTVDERKNSSEKSNTILIRILERKEGDKCIFQNIKYDPSVNVVTISSKAVCNLNLQDRQKSSGYDMMKKSKKIKCQINVKGVCKNVKFSSLCNMSEINEDHNGSAPSQLYSRVSEWISSHDFNNLEDVRKSDPTDIETNVDAVSDFTSITKRIENRKKNIESFRIVDEPVDTCDCKHESKATQGSHETFVSRMKNIASNKMVRSFSKFSQYSPLQSNCLYNNASSQQSQFSVILEGEESDLPENKTSTTSFKSVKLSHTAQVPVHPQQVSRPPSRHKRHADAMSQNKIGSMDRKTRKRRTLEKVGASVEERQKVLEDIVNNRTDRQNKRRQQRRLQTEQFLKSMQMLAANAKPDKSQPFEDYSIFLYRQTAPNFEDRVKDLEKQFTYVPDHENKLPNQTKAGADEEIATRIKNLEDKWKEPQPVEKKPKDLLRAIGKIETSDWNIKEIEKKIIENKLGKPSNKDKEKVPKWSKEQFLARQTKMEKQHLEKQDSTEGKFADIDKSIKNLELKLKEGTSRDLGQNKIASITEKLVSKVPEEPKPIQKSNSRTIVFPSQNASEFCHFCNKRVYLMERLSAEGRFFHHGCFRCQYCNTQLRLGSYAFDKDGLYGFKFFCIHHYGMQAEPSLSKVSRKPSQRAPRDVKSPDKRQIRVAGVDLLDRVQTPERIEFANLSTGQASSDHEDSLSQMDEDEWTDKNFGASAAECGSSDDESSSLSSTDSDDEDAFEEALEEPATKEGTMKWAEIFKKRYSRKRHDSESDEYSSPDHSSYYENTSDDDESDTATEGEEEIRARELRKQEVRVEPPVVQTDTGTDTEVVSEESSSSSSEIHNSATEISTDSEFAQDDPTPTRELPAIALNDFHVTKTRGSGGHPKKIQVTSGFLQRPSNGKAPKRNIELKLSPLVPSAPIISKPAPKLLPRTEGYALNRTQSTGGIAAKVSLELKKKYLLGEATLPGNIQKSGSASTLDTKLKSFHSNISDCQKLLKPAPEVSASMKTFCSKLDERVSPVLSPQSSTALAKNFDSKTENQTDSKETILPPPDVTNVEIKEEAVPVFENECEGRPRSPVHETSIIVPNIDWSKKKQNNSHDSLSESSEDEVANTPVFNYDRIPRVEIHTVEDVEEPADDIPPDSLCIEAEMKVAKEARSENHSSLASEPPKSITSEKKVLNQPKSLPKLEGNNIFPEIHTSLHIKKDINQDVMKKSDKQSPEEIKSFKTSSGHSSPSNADSGAEQMTAALTETELSDWARDEEVSDDLEGAEFEINQDVNPTRTNKNPKNIPFSKSDAKLANIGELDDMGHICDKKDKSNKEIKDFTNKTIITEAMNNLLSSNLDNIEFMDTGTETSSDDGLVDATNGYVLFKNEDDIQEDSLNPNINELVEAKNVYAFDRRDKPYNTGYCIYDNEDHNFGGKVIDLKPADLEKLKQKQNNSEHEDDSLLVIETGTTTEENTCSDSTVKNITEILPENENKLRSKPLVIENISSQKQRLEDKLAKLKAEQAIMKHNDENVNKKENNINSNSIEFHEHCQRLQSKVEFGNAKDSIDIRKSRRKSKTEIPKPDLIQEEKEKSSPIHSPKNVSPNLSPVIKTPDILYKKENIEKERDVNQKLIQEMVMNKMRAENKSLERKKRNRNISSNTARSIKPFELSKSATADIIPLENNRDGDAATNGVPAYSITSNSYATPDVLLTTNSVPLQKSQTVNLATTVLDESGKEPINDQQMRPLSVYSTLSENSHSDRKSTSETLTSNPENPNLSDIGRPVYSDDFKTPVAPPRQKHEDARKTAEKLKQNARARARLLSNEELGLSPEDKLAKLKERVAKQKLQGKNKENNIIDVHVQENIEPLVMSPEKRSSWLYANDTLKKKKNSSFRRSKSGDNSDRNTGKQLTCLNSSDNIKADASSINSKKLDKIKVCKSDPNLLDTDCKKLKKKSKDRERKKSISTIISGLFSSKKSPTGSHSRGLFSRISPKSKGLSKDVLLEEPVRRKSFSEPRKPNRETPPPIPPLPVNYTGFSHKDDSSDGDHDWHKDRSSCDTLDHSSILDCSTSSLAGRRSSKGARKAARQAQAKRHRMAQEIQRKLEEIEVKTRELEQQGVLVEKALRGENEEGNCKEESELLQDWFDLMRDRTELRRYEKELLIRAQDLELEDRHARLQHELRERMENDEKKTQEDQQIERSIINEMMEIVEKRDSLIAVLEEDRLRYSSEDRDFEEQILAKGLRLTSLKKTSDK